MSNGQNGGGASHGLPDDAREGTAGSAPEYVPDEVAMRRALETPVPESDEEAHAAAELAARAFAGALPNLQHAVALGAAAEQILRERDAARAWSGGFAALLADAFERSGADVAGVAAAVRLHPGTLDELRLAELPPTDVRPEVLVRLAEALRLDRARLLDLVRVDAERFTADAVGVPIANGLDALARAWDEGADAPRRAADDEHPAPPG